jgi:hypothetical protein
VRAELVYEAEGETSANGGRGETWGWSIWSVWFADRTNEKNKTNQRNQNDDCRP